MGGGMMAEGGEGATMEVGPEMLPAGMAEKVNVGDILEFRVVSKDGKIQVEYNHGEGGGGEEKAGMGEGKGEEDEWAQDLKSEMSPRKEQEGASY